MGAHHTELKRFAALIKVIAVMAARRAGPKVAAAVAGVAVLVGFCGVAPAQALVRATSATPVARVSTLLIWLLITTPAAGALLAVRPLTLRALPISRLWWLAAFSGLLLALDAPWAALFGLGNGFSAALAMGLAAVAGHALQFGNWRRWTTPLSALPLAAAVLLLPPGSAMLSCAFATATIAIPTTWSHLPDRGPRPAVRLVRGPLPIALASAELAILIRSMGSTGTRAIVSTLFGAGVAALAIRNNHGIEAPTMRTISLACAGVGVGLSCAMVAARLNEIERSLSDLLAAARIPATIRVFSLTAATAAVGAMLGLLHGALVAPSAAGSSASRFIAEAVLAGAALSTCAALRVRGRAIVADDDEHPVRRAMLVPIVFGVLCAWFGEPALLALITAAVAFIGWSVANRSIAETPLPHPSVPEPRLTGLRVEGLTKSLGGRKVLDALTFAFNAPATVSIAGSNGAGKSTLLRVLAGIHLPDAGSATFDGASLHGLSGQGRRSLAYVPDGDHLPEHLTVVEGLHLISTLRDAPPATPELLGRLGVESLLARPISILSLGQRQRVGLAAGFLGAPRLLLLDEPTTGLSPGMAKVLLELLAEQRAAGGLALVATHDPELADRLPGPRMMLVDGKLETEHKLPDSEI